MARYQIRTPENMEIEDVIEKMATKSWDAIVDFMDPERNPPSRKNFHRFHTQIRDSIAPHLKAFRLCGLSNICIDATLEAPLASQPKKVGGNPWDLVYHVFIQGNAREFVENLATEALQSVEDCVKPGMQEQALHAITHAFREALADYLVYNPLCGKTELCIYSGTDEIPHWNREEHPKH